jgi:hypothetical protein
VSESGRGSLGVAERMRERGRGTCERGEWVPNAMTKPNRDFGLTALVCSHTKHTHLHVEGPFGGGRLGVAARAVRVGVAGFRGEKRHVHNHHRQRPQHTQVTWNKLPQVGEEEWSGQRQLGGGTRAVRGLRRGYLETDDHDGDPHFPVGDDHLGNVLHDAGSHSGRGLALHEPQYREEHGVPEGCVQQLVRRHLRHDSNRVKTADNATLPT